jgi:hypothetical protein
MDVVVIILGSQLSAAVCASVSVQMPSKTSESGNEICGLVISFGTGQLHALDLFFSENAGGKETIKEGMTEHREGRGRGFIT